MGSTQFGPLKHFGLDINASRGAASDEECREAFGAFFLGHSGYPTNAVVRVLADDETFEFTYKGNVWRVSFILAYEVNLKKTVPFRIHFDYIREAAIGNA